MDIFIIVHWTKTLQMEKGKVKIASHTVQEKHSTTKTLAATQSFFLDAADENELSHCKNALSKTNHCCSNRNGELVDLIKVSNNDLRADNANAKVTSAQVSPLLIGKVRFGELGSTHVRRVVEELRLKNVAADVKIGVRKLTEIAKDNEHPQ